jgi:DNA-binding transcriptional MerR regulator
VIHLWLFPHCSDGIEGMPKKPVKKLFKIGEVAEYSGLSRQTVNYYTVLGILREAGRTKSGHRLYDESVFDRIDKIRELQSTRTLKEIADYFQAEGKQEQPDGQNNKLS